MKQIIKLLALFVVWLLCFSCQSHQQTQTTIAESIIRTYDVDSVGILASTLSSTFNSDENITYEDIYITFDTVDSQVATEAAYEIRARPKTLSIGRVSKSATVALTDSISTTSNTSTTRAATTNGETKTNTSTVEDVKTSSLPYIQIILLLLTVSLLVWYYRHNRSSI